MNLERVILSWDNPFSVHSSKKFLKYLDDKVALGNFIGTPQMGIGCYQGEIEPCVMLLAKDYDKYIKGAHFIEKQESVLRVPGDIRQPCVLEFRYGMREALGPMREINDPQHYQGWTYINGNYWSCDK